MFIQVPVVIAHEAHRTAADGIRLTVKHVDARSVLNNHNFMKIMMMLRERSLRQPWLNRDRRSPRRKKKSTLCSTVITAPTNEKSSQNSN